MRRLPALLGTITAALVAAPAHAEGPPALTVTSIDAAIQRTLTVADTAPRDCSARLTSGRGIARTTFIAPADGAITARLRGGTRSGDWDLALFDAASGRMVGSSESFWANEVAQAGVHRGDRLVIQACRRSGGTAAVRLTTQLARIDAAQLLAPAPTARLVRVTVPSHKAFQALENSGLDVTHDVGTGYAKVILYGAADVRRLTKLGLSWRTVVPDLAAADRRARAADRSYAQLVGRSALPSGRTAYRTYEDYQDELKKMVEQYPELVRPVALTNKSVQGRDIQTVEIAANVKDGDEGRPVFTLGAVHHAREWPAAEAAIEFAWDVLKNHGSDPNLENILQNVRIVLMPLTNPDGYISSRTAVDPDGGAATGAFPTGGNFAYRRKNCNDLVAGNGSIPCDAAIGVDNNRNYGQDWGGPGASTSPIDQSYRGSGPFSEPETRAVRELSWKTNSPVHISVHTVAAKVLRPPGLEADGFAPDEAALKALGLQMANPTGYTNEYGWQLYDTTGSSKDWGYGALGQFGYTIELGGSDFHGDYNQHVVQQYQPTSGTRKGRGVREAFIKGALYTRNAAQFSRLTGAAPAGATLRIKKDFVTESYPVCTVVNPLAVDTIEQVDYCTAPTEVIESPEHINVTMKVPAEGRYTWWLNPSTRPFSKTPEAYTLTCEVGGKVKQTETVFLARGEAKPLDLTC
jgi:murein tripeptide amidase MpaA